MLSEVRAKSRPFLRIPHGSQTIVSLSASSLGQLARIMKSNKSSLTAAAEAGDQKRISVLRKSSDLFGCSVKPTTWYLFKNSSGSYNLDYKAVGLFCTDVASMTCYC